MSNRMDDDRPVTGPSDSTSTAAVGSLSFIRAAVVLIVFVVATAVLVAVGTRPSVSSTTTTPSTTVTTAAAGAKTSSTTATTAAAGGGSASTSTTTAKSKHKHGSSGTTTTTAPHSATTVVVANATSTDGLAAHFTSVIGAGGWTMQTPIDAATSEATSAVYYVSGQQQQAASIATSIGVKPTQVLPFSSATPVAGVSGTDVVVVIGQDLAATVTTTTAS
jgi:hypothetical protein